MSEVAADRAGLLRATEFSLPLIVFLSAFVLTLAGGGRLLLDPNPYMHITVGRWIIAHRAVPHVDLFSYSHFGQGWATDEWLAEVLTAGLYDWLGWAGVVAGAALCFAAALGILCRALLRYLTPSQALIATAVAAGMTLPHLFARPHAFALPLMAGWIALMISARTAERAPPMAAALLMIPWVNLHPGFPFGLGFAALLAAEAVFSASTRRAAVRTAGAWALFGAVALAACCVTPYGIAGLLLPFRILNMDFVMARIQEWQSPNFQLPQPLEPWLMLVLLSALSLGLRLPPTRTAIILILLHMALQHQRHAELLGFATPLLAAPALAPQLIPYTAAGLDRRLASLRERAGARAWALVIVAVTALGAVAMRIGLLHDSGPFAPASAIAFAKAQGFSGPVFNDVNFGDYLIFIGIPPFVDGRVDMYGNDFMQRYAQLAAFPNLAAQYGFIWAVIRPDNPHVPLLDHLAGWRRVFADDTAIVYRRD